MQATEAVLKTVRAKLAECEAEDAAARLACSNVEEVLRYLNSPEHRERHGYQCGLMYAIGALEVACDQYNFEEVK